MKAKNPKVSVIMGSQSDMPIMKEALEALEHFKISYEIEIVSAHRTPKKMQTFATKAASRGIEVIVAGAGGAAHLPGMVASLTTLPVIGVPIAIGALKKGQLKGLDALLSIAQMPKGVPVATMAVDNAYNAGVMAARILALSSKALTTKLYEFEKLQKAKVKAMNKNLIEQVSLTLLFPSFFISS